MSKKILYEDEKSKVEIDGDFLPVTKVESEKKIAGKRVGATQGEKLDYIIEMLERLV